MTNLAFALLRISINVTILLSCVLAGYIIGTKHVIIDSKEVALLPYIDQFQDEYNIADKDMEGLSYMFASLGSLNGSRVGQCNTGIKLVQIDPVYWYSSSK